MRAGGCTGRWARVCDVCVCVCALALVCEHVRVRFRLFVRAVHVHACVRASV